MTKFSTHQTIEPIIKYKLNGITVERVSTHSVLITGKHHRNKCYTKNIDNMYFADELFDTPEEVIAAIVLPTKEN